MKKKSQPQCLPEKIDDFVPYQQLERKLSTTKKIYFKLKEEKWTFFRWAATPFENKIVMDLWTV